MLYNKQRKKNTTYQQLGGNALVFDKRNKNIGDTGADTGGLMSDT